MQTSKGKATRSKERHLVVLLVARLNRIQTVTNCMAYLLKLLHDA